ncbi:Smr/MutS family protein [Histidinibacterium aquaticum]|uniref:DNA mismatch repair protein MutS n=1 Tax=Histidinibacterium aquaticum TaxID=2613962 RepID=A0A5J5GFH0_9RHOB|nr:Smr/MutS family protein [Histidinibacterium aquaticum]KAA9006817.1 DNA mismatch repair protein MutS [Histidinibacterium aquaticum]
MTRKRRHLSPEERNLWDSVARSTDPLHKRRRDPAPDPPKEALTRPRTDERARNTTLSPFEIGGRVDHSRDHDLMAGLSEQLSQKTVRMDRKKHTKLKRGKLSPEGRLDLHGMTLAQAHPELMDFVLTAHARGKRILLVITGKGKHREEPGPIPQKLGVLRHQVPQWLRMPPLGPLVLDVVPAHLSHGGGGAYYVVLRRSR